MNARAVPYDSAAADYVIHRSFHPNVLRLIALCNGVSFSRILEVGCGTGNYIADRLGVFPSRFITAQRKIFNLFFCTRRAGRLSLENRPGNQKGKSPFFRLGPEWRVDTNQRSSEQPRTPR